MLDRVRPRGERDLPPHGAPAVVRAVAEVVVPVERLAQVVAEAERRVR